MAFNVEKRANLETKKSQQIATWRDCGPKTYFDVFGTLFKELFQNVEVEDEQLWSIDE